MMHVIEGSEMPLPKSNYGNSILQLYTAEQMLAYGKLCINAYKKSQSTPVPAMVKTELTTTAASNVLSPAETARVQAVLDRVFPEV
jgi:hypothetical protein